MRSFIVTRALVRRAHFTKTFEDNKQVVLMREKLTQHRQHCENQGTDNDFDEEPDALKDPTHGGMMLVSP